MNWKPEKLIEELKELIQNCEDNEIVGLASVLLCLLDQEYFN